MQPRPQRHARKIARAAQKQRRRADIAQPLFSGKTAITGRARRIWIFPPLAGNNTRCIYPWILLFSRRAPRVSSSRHPSLRRRRHTGSSLPRRQIEKKGQQSVLGPASNAQSRRCLAPRGWWKTCAAAAARIGGEKCRRFVGFFVSVMWNGSKVSSSCNEELDLGGERERFSGWARRLY